ncbi:hypothetical protein GX586_09810, partial [bacterium]|nr:hypothetical protein [bacterium]
MNAIATPDVRHAGRAILSAAMILACAAASQAAIYLDVDVVNAAGGAPMPAVLEMRYNTSGGAFLPDGDAGWTDPQGVFAFGPTWRQSIGDAPATIWIQAWHGDEFEYTNITVAVPAEGTNITIALTPRVDMTALGWWAGGDHNHLGRGGDNYWKHNGGVLSMEYVATMLSAMGYDWWQCGGWRFELNGDPLSTNRTFRSTNYLTDPNMRNACNAFNTNYPCALNLWYNNEYSKGRYGHMWSVGKSTAPNNDYPHPNTYPTKSAQGDGYIHNWWGFYDPLADLWQAYLGEAPRDWYWPAYMDTSAHDLPPDHEKVWAMNNAHVYSIWAHLTATSPAMFTKHLPFDLITGVKIGGVAMLGAIESTSFQMCLDAYNRGYQFAGFGENDTFYNSPVVSRNYTFIYCPVVTKATFDLNTVMEWACLSNKTISTSGALAILDADNGAITIGDNVAADGSSHTLRIRAWANPRPGDVLANVSLYRNGTIFQSWSPNTTRFETNVVVSETSRAYYLLKVNDNVTSRKCITSPIYFVPDTSNPLPPIIKADISGGVYDYRGAFIPNVQVDLLYTGALHATTMADAAGSYRFTNVPADCVLWFHNGSGLDERRCPMFHDERMNDYFLRTITGEFYYAGGGLGNVLEANVYETMSNMIRNCTVNVNSKQYVPLATFDSVGWDGWSIGSSYQASLNTAKARQGGCIKLVRNTSTFWSTLLYRRDVTAMADWKNAVGLIVALNGASGWPETQKIYLQFTFLVIDGNVTNTFFRNTPYMQAGDRWHEFYMPLSSNLFTGSKVLLDAAVLFTGASGATLYMDELRAIIARPPGLAPTLLSPADGACIPTNRPTLVWSGDDPSVTNFAVVVDDGAAVSAGLAQQFTVPAPLAEGTHEWFVIAGNGAAVATSAVRTFTVDTVPPSLGTAAFTTPSSGEVWLEGTTRDPAWTSAGISDAHLDTNATELSYHTGSEYQTIASTINCFAGTWPWFVSGIPQTYSNTHLRLAVRDTAGNTASIFSPLFTLVDQGEVKTSAWRYVTVYPYNTAALNGFVNGSRAAVTWDPSNAYAGAGCLRGTITVSGGWESCTSKADISGDANWLNASSMRFRANFPADVGFPGLSRIDMIFMFWTNNVEHRQTVVRDGAWHEYEIPLNSNYFKSPPVR